MIRHPFAHQLHVGIALGPGAFVPPPADDPFALRRGGGARLHELHGLGLVAGAGEVDALQVGAEAGDVGVRVHQPGDQRGAAQVDHAGGRAAVGGGVLAAAHEHDPLAGDRHRLGVGMPGAVAKGCVGGGRAVGRRVAPGEGVDAAVLEDEVGGLGGSGRLPAAGRDQERWKRQRKERQASVASPGGASRVGHGFNIYLGCARSHGPRSTSALERPAGDRRRRP